MRKVLLAVASLGVLAACGGGDSGTTEVDAAEMETADTQTRQPVSGTIMLTVSDTFQSELQTALIEAAQGSTIMLPAGTFAMTDGLSLDVDGVTLEGAGEGETILDFAGQRGSGEGLLVTSDNVVLQNFTIRNTKGDGIKSKGADQIIYRDLTVEWEGEPDEENGAYGVYPVESENVLIEDVTVRGASDAGIYVGQSRQIIVRDSIAEYNVAGIEIENSSHADVYGNTARHNAGGILVFDLPDLPVMGGNSTRIYDNDIVDNNTRNFAPPGNIVAGVPSGTGVIIMANEKVVVENNRFNNNQTVQVLITAYSQDFSDEDYNPLPRDIVVRNNTYGEGGNNPQGELAQFAILLGGTLPDVIWDGVTSWGESDEPVAVNLAMDESEDVSFVNLGLKRYPIELGNVSPTTERPGGDPFGELPDVELAHAE